MSSNAQPPPSPRRTSLKRNSSLSKKTQPSENGSTGNSKSASPLSSMSGDRTVKRLRLSKALTIPEDTTVSDACRRMATRRIDAVLLTDSNTWLSGIVTDKDIATRVIAEELKPEETLISTIMTRNPIFVNSDALAFEALHKMVQGRFRHLPVVENGEVVAMLDITKCLYDAISKMEKVAEQGSAIAAAVEGQLGSNSTGPQPFMETLKERMFKPALSTIIDDSSKLAIVSPTDPIHVAAKRMLECQTSYVIATSENKIQGILTSKDILMRVVAASLSPESLLVEKIMTLNPDCAKLETTVLEALHIMHDGKFLHLPVLDKDGSVAACVDVLQLTHAAISMVESSSGALNSVANLVMQKFWDSALGSEQGDDIDSQSDISITFPSEAAEMMKSLSRGLQSPTRGLRSSFSFKFVDQEGKVHRFDLGFEKLDKLISSVAQRIGASDDQQRPNLLYEDEDGDRILLTSDSDLVGAVSRARSAGQKMLRLHVEFPAADQKQAQAETATVLGRRWTPFHAGFVAGAAVVTSVAVVTFLRHQKLASS